MTRLDINKNGTDPHHYASNFAHAKDKLAEGAEAAFDSVIEMLEKAGYEVKKQSNEARDNVEKYVKANPFKAVGFSVLAGMILALIAKR